MVVWHDYKDIQINGCKQLWPDIFKKCLPCQGLTNKFQEQGLGSLKDVL